MGQKARIEQDVPVVKMSGEELRRSEPEWVRWKNFQHKGKWAVMQAEVDKARAKGGDLTKVPNDSGGGWRVAQGRRDAKAKEDKDKKQQRGGTLMPRLEQYTSTDQVMQGASLIAMMGCDAFEKQRGMTGSDEPLATAQTGVRDRSELGLEKDVSFVAEGEVQMKGVFEQQGEDPVEWRMPGGWQREWGHKAHMSGMIRSRAAALVGSRIIANLKSYAVKHKREGKIPRVLADIIDKKQKEGLNLCGIMVRKCTRTQIDQTAAVPEIRLRGRACEKEAGAVAQKGATRNEQQRGMRLAGYVGLHAIAGELEEAREDQPVAGALGVKGTFVYEMRGLPEDQLVVGDNLGPRWISILGKDWCHNDGKAVVNGVDSFVVNREDSSRGKAMVNGLTDCFDGKAVIKGVDSTRGKAVVNGVDSFVIAEGAVTRVNDGGNFVAKVKKAPWKGEAAEEDQADAAGGGVIGGGIEAKMMQDMQVKKDKERWARQMCRGGVYTRGHTQGDHFGPKAECIDGCEHEIELSFCWDERRKSGARRGGGVGRALTMWWRETGPGAYNVWLLRPGNARQMGQRGRVG